MGAPQIGSAVNTMSRTVARCADFSPLRVSAHKVYSDGSPSTCRTISDEGARFSGSINARHAKRPGTEMEIKTTINTKDGSI